MKFDTCMKEVVKLSFPILHFPGHNTEYSNIIVLVHWPSALYNELEFHCMKISW